MSTEEIFDLVNENTTQADGEDARSARTQKTTATSNTAMSSAPADDVQSRKTQKTTKSGAAVSISPSSHFTEDAKSTRTQKDDAQSRCTQKTGKSSCKGGDDDPSLYAPNYPLPCGVGEGTTITIIFFVLSKFRPTLKEIGNLMQNEIPFVKFQIASTIFDF